MSVKSDGWQPATITNNPRHLVKSAVSTRVNVHADGIEMEILIHDLDAPVDERWTSIVLDRRTGAASVGRHRDREEAWKLAAAEPE